MNNQTDDMLQVGVITGTHGVRGEVKVFPTTDDPARFKKLKTVLLDSGKEQLTLGISQVKFFKNLVILKFKEFDNINDVEKYKNASLLVTREQAVPLAEGEYFIADLIGLSVQTEDGKKLGILTDVMQSAANDVYVVQMEDGKEILIPAIKQCILGVDLNEKIMKVYLLPGLLDL